MNPNRKPISIILLFLQIQFLLTNSYPTAMNCTDTKRVCTSFIAFQPGPSQNQTSSVLQSMFDVLQNDITIEKNEKNYVFVKKNCSCSSQVKKYLTNTTYTVRSDDDGVLVHDAVIDAYDGLAYIAKSSRKTRVGAVVSLQLFCGCSSGLWNYLMSYVLKDGDSVESLASRFGVSMDSIETVNGFSNPDNVTVGELYYIPLNTVPGEPYPTETDLPPAPVPSPPADIFSENQRDGKAKVPYAWILGSVGIGIGLIVVTVLACILLRSSCCFAKSQGGSVKGPDGKNHHNFHILRPTTFLCGSGRYICCKPGDWRPTNGEPTDRHINIPKAIGTDVYDMEKPVVFQYDEVLFSTDRFADSNLLGNGTYGSVYYGLLRDQEVAIKRMNAMKTKEFLAEMKVLCKVHHSNLVELIGYAATDDELFLIYEYSQKGSLRSHLHDPQNKGQTTLSWIMRVQIALDAARGLEYIHEHTKTHYVHRDIKSSNILLDGAFRAKISDFGLAKLIGKTNEGEEASVTRVVGTFGYLAPEYLSDGLATTKSDVYAFGVVLFEMISGREAITRTEGLATKNSERRSLASIMLAALKNSPDCMTMASMKDYIDPNLMKLYPHDCLFKMAILAKHCVDEDPILRPDMKQIVISLSQILLSSVEWEATLSGNSQVFSGLVQGR